MLDLVLPWRQAVADGPAATEAFRQEHAALLERVRLYQTPHVPVLPLEVEPALLPRDPETEAGLRVVLRQAAAQGLLQDVLPVRLPLRALLDPFLAIPGAPPLVLIAPQFKASQASVTLARGLALLTRWSWQHPVDLGRTTPWERAAMEPLRQAIYAHGLAWHAAQALHPDEHPAHLFGVSAAAWQRMREREHRGRAVLQSMLDQPGLGPLLAWLPAAASTGSRVPSLGSIPPRFGHYLAWRLTARRVERRGLLDALRATA